MRSTPRGAAGPGLHESKLRGEGTVVLPVQGGQARIARIGGGFEDIHRRFAETDVGQAGLRARDFPHRQGTTQPPAESGGPQKENDQSRSRRLVLPQLLERDRPLCGTLCTNRHLAEIDIEEKGG